MCALVGQAKDLIGKKSSWLQFWTYQVSHCDERSFDSVQEKLMLSTSSCVVCDPQNYLNLTNFLFH